MFLTCFFTRILLKEEYYLVVEHIDNIVGTMAVSNLAPAVW